jgi:hypothetical protein
MEPKECKWWSRPFLERSSSERATGRSRSSTGSTSKSGRGDISAAVALFPELRILWRVKEGPLSGGSGRC